MEGRNRKSVLAGTKRLVIKVGSSIITDEGLNLSEEKLRRLAEGIHDLPLGVKEVIIVTSGAIAAGRGKCNLPRPSNIPQKQAMAALGQSRLMWAYEKIFSEQGRKVAQVLLTLDDFNHRRRFINARNTIFTLLSWGVIPVVNENDTVAVEEIKFGDNDTLSALVTSLSEADLLVILSDVEGLYDGDPGVKADARLIPEVGKVDAKLLAVAGGSASGVGTGGMVTKLQAAAKVIDLGVPVVIANGHTAGVIPRIMSGEEIGTLFLPRKEKLAGRKHWIRHTLRPKGTLVVDGGGVEAILGKGRSLLSVGIKGVEGDFKAGDPVRCVDEAGREFARGLVNFSAREIQLIKGRHTDEIESILGYKYYDEVIHRDDLVIIK